jgi:hypothetical protein
VSRTNPAETVVGGMTQIDARTGQSVQQQMADGAVRDEHEPTPDEVLEWRRDDVFLPEADVCPEEYPHPRTSRRILANTP